MGHGIDESRLTWRHPILDHFKDDCAHVIICDGQEIPIGLNLHEAPQHFFVDSSIEPDLRWVDAI